MERWNNPAINHNRVFLTAELKYHGSYCDDSSEYFLEVVHNIYNILICKLHIHINI